MFRCIQQALSTSPSWDSPRQSTLPVCVHSSQQSPEPRCTGPLPSLLPSPSAGQWRAVPKAEAMTRNPGHISVPPAPQNPLQPLQGARGAAPLQTLRAYLVPFAQDLPRPRLYAPEQRVLDHAEHGVAGGNRDTRADVGWRGQLGDRCKLARQRVRGREGGAPRAPPAEQRLVGRPRALGGEEAGRAALRLCLEFLQVLGKSPRPPPRRSLTGLWDVCLQTDCLPPSSLKGFRQGRCRTSYLSRPPSSVHRCGLSHVPGRQTWRAPLSSPAPLLHSLRAFLSLHPKARSRACTELSRFTVLLVTAPSPLPPPQTSDCHISTDRYP